MPTAHLVMDSESTPSDGTIGGGATNKTDAVYDWDGKYLQLSTKGAQQTWGVAPLTAGAGKISAVRCEMVAKRTTNGGNTDFKATVVLGGTSSPTLTFTNTTAYSFESVNVPGTYLAYYFFPGEGQQLQVERNPTNWPDNSGRIDNVYLEIDYSIKRGGGFASGVAGFIGAAMGLGEMAAFARFMRAFERTRIYHHEYEEIWRDIREMTFPRHFFFKAVY